MNGIGNTNLLLSILILTGLAGCGTMSGNDRDVSQSDGAQTRTTQQGTQTVPDNAVKTGMSEAESSDTAVSQDSKADADRSRQASQPQSSDRAPAVQVNCSEPANAQPGQCFSRVLYPAKFNQQDVQEVVRPAYEKITYTDPVYEDVQEQVLVREAYMREIEVPALYDTFYEQQLEKPAGKIWKKGRGAVERVDPQTGEIYCLVEEPAVYRTVERKELKRPAGKRTDTVPAEYATRTVHKLVTPPQEVRTTVPAETAAVPKKTLVSGDSCEYVQVLCQDNATADKIHEVERALQQRGFQVDNDGLDDEDLAAALHAFQEKNDLPTTGLMTARTLESLGVALEPVQKPETATGGTRQ
jgi:hypothetical protein